MVVANKLEVCVRQGKRVMSVNSDGIYELLVIKINTTCAVISDMYNKTYGD